MSESGDACGELCELCSRDGKLRCSRCGWALYCSPECQKRGWRDHRSTCLLPGQFNPEWKLVPGTDSCHNTQLAHLCGEEHTVRMGALRGLVDMFIFPAGFRDLVTCIASYAAPTLFVSEFSSKRQWIGDLTFGLHTKIAPAFSPYLSQASLGLHPEVCRIEKWSLRSPLADIKRTDMSVPYLRYRERYRATANSVLAITAPPPPPITFEFAYMVSVLQYPEHINNYISWPAQQYFLCRQPNQRRDDTVRHVRSAITWTLRQRGDKSYQSRRKFQKRAQGRLLSAITNAFFDKSKMEDLCVIVQTDDYDAKTAAEFTTFTIPQQNRPLIIQELRHLINHAHNQTSPTTLRPDI